MATGNRPLLLLFDGNALIHRAFHALPPLTQSKTGELVNAVYGFASTLLVPGYVDRQEVSNLARFISSLSPDIPYSLLAFAPQFMMRDLPTTSRRHAEECLAEAQAQGLKRVRVGNVHLLGKDY